MESTNGALHILMKTNCKIFILSFAALAVFAVPVAEVAGANDSIHSLTTLKARLPIYNKDRLQFFVYCQKLQRQANATEAQDAIIDIIRAGVNVDNIKYLDNVKAYPLKAPALQVLEFWKDKPHSDGLIMSSAASIDQNNKTVSGKEKVYFRSPMLDLDGIGFLASYEKRTVFIQNDVQIVIRMAAVEAAQKKSAKASDASPAGDVLVTADTMFIDFDKNSVPLEGNVKVNESRFAIDCNKLILYMKAGAADNLTDQGFLKSDSKKIEPAKDKKDDNQQALSKIVCIGNVVITRKLSQEDLDKGAQVAKAGKAVYDLNTQQIVLTEDTPSIARGSDVITGKSIMLWRTTERMQVEKDAVITMKIPKKAEEKAKPAKVAQLKLI